jgi:hypothetical protein
MKKHLAIVALLPILFASAILVDGSRNPRATTSACPVAHIAQSQQPEEPPAYHKAPPTEPLPETLDPRQFSDTPTAFVAYSIVRQMPKILYQIPCACPCRVTEKHQSLFDCFRTKHGLWCDACKKEVFFCREAQKKRLTTSEMRKQIEARQWTKVDAESYAKAYLAEEGKSQK